MKFLRPSTIQVITETITKALVSYVPWSDERGRKRTDDAQNNNGVIHVGPGDRKLGREKEKNGGEGSEAKTNLQV